MDVQIILLIGLLLDAARPDESRCKHCGDEIYLIDGSYRARVVSDPDDLYDWDQRQGSSLIRYETRCVEDYDWGSIGAHTPGWVNQEMVKTAIADLDAAWPEDTPEIQAAKETYKVLMRNWAGSNLDLRKAALAL